MRRVRLIRRPSGRSRRPLFAEEDPRGEKKRRLSAELEFYRHRCDENWLNELLEAEGLAGKRLTPSRARRLLLAASRKRWESQ
ncbi:hypothetical protein [Nitratifractor sp.]